MTEPAFPIGARVRIRAEDLDGYKSEFRRFVARKVGTVVAHPEPGHGWSWKVLVEFPPGRRVHRALSRREWLPTKHLEACPSP